MHFGPSQTAAESQETGRLRSNNRRPRSEASPEHGLTLSSSPIINAVIRSEDNIQTNQEKKQEARTESCPSRARGKTQFRRDK